MLVGVPCGCHQFVVQTPANGYHTVYLLYRKYVGIMWKDTFHSYKLNQDQAFVSILGKKCSLNLDIETHSYHEEVFGPKNDEYLSGYSFLSLLFTSIRIDGQRLPLRNWLERSQSTSNYAFSENVLSLGEWSIWDKVVAICIMVSEDILSPYDHPQSMVQSGSMGTYVIDN